MRHAGPADALFLSLNAESPYIFRHRKLGYALYVHEFRLKDLGPAVLQWLRQSFERVERSPADIQRDYRVLIDTVRARADTTILIQNVMSTVGNETIHHYASYDRPMGATLSCVHTKDLNLMLHDLARERDIDIVDFDAIAAEFGGMVHLPDGVHPSGAMQAEARSEVLRILHARGVPGFGRFVAYVISKSTSHGATASSEPGNGSAGSSLSRASGRPIFSQCPRFAQDAAQGTALSGPHFDNRLVRLQFDDHRTHVEAPADVAVPFENAQFVDVLDRSGNHQLPDHAFYPVCFAECQDSSLRIAFATLSASGRVAASRTGFDDTGAASAPTRATRISPSCSRTRNATSVPTPHVA